MNNQSSGLLGENAACAFLQRQKYRILERNYRKRCGEIDIIAQKGNKIVFVEVKTRSGSLYGTPGEAVTHTKQQKIIKTAQAYICENNLDAEFSFDVIEIFYKGTAVLSLNHIENAFST